MKALTNRDIGALKLKQAECDAADGIPNGGCVVTLREAIVILLEQAEHTRRLRVLNFHQKRQIHAVDAVVNALEDFYPEVVDLAVEQCTKHREQRRLDGGSNLDTIDDFVGGSGARDLEADLL